jgi:protein-tyrosine phosphatase
MYWVRKDRIGGSQIPSNLEDVRDWKRRGVKKVLVLAEEWEIEEVWGSVDYYFQLLREEGFRVLHLPTPDGYPPTLEDFGRALRWLDEGSNVVHCVAGKGRTGTVIAGYLLVKEGFNPEEAVEEVRRYRPNAVDSVQQLLFLYKLRELNLGK